MECITNIGVTLSAPISGGEIFGLTDEMHVDMYFDHTRIRKEDFEFIVKKSNGCRSFYINLLATPTNANEPVYTIPVSVMESRVM